MRICSGPAATSSWIFSPAPPARSARSTGSGRADEARTSSAALSGWASSAAHVAARPSGGLEPRFQTGPVVLDHQRGQPARQRGVGNLGREPVDVGVDAARRDDHPRRVDDRGRGVEHHVDAVHRVGVARPPDRDDPAAGDAEARVADAEHRVGDEAADDRDLDPAALGADAEPVAHRVAEPGEDPVWAAAVVGLRHEPEVGVGEPDAVRHRGTPARGRAPARPRARPRRRAARRPGPRGRGSRARRRTGAG